MPNYSEVAIPTIRLMTVKTVRHWVNFPLHFVATSIIEQFCVESDKTNAEYNDS